MKPIHILRPGSFQDRHGQEVEFSAEDLASMAENYDPAKHEAPLVIGHPKTDAPAYGWVESLSSSKRGLYAHPHRVHPEFAEMVREGRFGKVSVSVYGPDHPGNPAPGAHSIKHVGFLGATPPAIKGLQQVELGEADDAPILTLDFAIAPEPTSQENDMPRPKPQDKPEDDPSKRETELSELAAKLDKRETELAERETAARRDELKRKIDAHADAGRVLPRDVDALVSLAEQLSDPEVEIQFSDSEGKEKKQAGVAWLLDFLERQPKQVEYGELTADAGEKPPARRFNAPAGVQVDPQGSKAHQKILDYAQKNDVDYETALTATMETE